ncbi:MAG: c-type cytochrome [Bacteroidia bacterium]|jgi:mono/diheme cytochrome c family protein
MRVVVIIFLVSTLTLLAGFKNRGTITWDGFIADSVSNGEKQFKRNCAVCHSYKKDQKLVGASLYNIVRDKDDDWVISYTLDEFNFMLPVRGDHYRQDGLDVNHQFKTELTIKDVSDIIKYIRTRTD